MIEDDEHAEKSATFGSHDSKNFRVFRQPEDELEPRTVVWVYDYNKNKTMRMTTQELLRRAG